MNASQKIALLKSLSSDRVLRTEFFYETLEECGDLKFNYHNYMAEEIPLALKFLSTGACHSKTAFETARQFNLLRDAFSQILPNEAIYDKDNPMLLAPWTDNLSGIVTSCGNLYTTSDGKDLLYEVVAILTYAHYLEVDVESLGWSSK